LAAEGPNLKIRFVAANPAAKHVDPVIVNFFKNQHISTLGTAWHKQTAAQGTPAILKLTAAPGTDHKGHDSASHTIVHR
jgi:hypothetical protein